MKSCKIPELLIPAGTITKLRTAIAYGADAVYVGADQLSMRPGTASFSIEDLHEGVAITHAAGKKIYVGVNSLLFENDLSILENWLNETKDIDFDAIIIADPAALTLVKKITPNREIHISTQLSTANAIAAKFWADCGATRVVLARECTLAAAKEIAAQKNIEVEIFVHGSMCVAVSGRCLLSAHLTGMNASQGQCKHTCRWDWQLVESKRPGMSVPVFETGKETIFLGSTDLCLIKHIPELFDTGVVSLKVEGRMKGEYYIAAVTRAYRDALDKYAADPDNYTYDPQWMDELRTLTHQPYETGFAFGYPSDNPESLQTDHRHGGTHDIYGIVESGSKNRYLVQVKHPFAVGETLEWFGPNMTKGEVRINEIFREKGGQILKSHCGTNVYIELEEDQDLPDMAILRKFTGEVKNCNCGS